MLERLNALRDAALRLGAKAVAVVRNSAARERFWAAGTFALIFGFFVAGVDYVISGGPDWNPEAPVTEAHAAQVHRVAALAPSAPPALSAALQQKAEALEAEGGAVVEEIDYSFTTEVLLGGPDTVLASAEYDVDILMSPIEISFSPELDALRASSKPPLSVSLDASLW